MASPSKKFTLAPIVLIAALALIAVTIMPIFGTMNVSVDTPIGSGDKVVISADVARNGSTVTLSYYYDANNNGLDDDGGSWIKIANVTDGGQNDAANKTHPNGFIVFSWMTPELKAGQYIIKVEDPYGPNRTTLMRVENYPLHLNTTIYGPKGTNDKGLVRPGEYCSVVTFINGNCRLCHTTDNPTKDNPGVNENRVRQSVSADFSQLSGNAGDTNVSAMEIHHMNVGWRFYASKSLADNATVSADVRAKNPANGLQTTTTAYAGVNKEVNIPQKSTEGTPSGRTTAGNTTGNRSSNPLPGFEVVFALVTLTFVAYLVNRKR
jgi:hypothetical protein